MTTPDHDLGLFLLDVRLAAAGRRFEERVCPARFAKVYVTQLEVVGDDGTLYSARLAHQADDADLHLTRPRDIDAYKRWMKHRYARRRSGVRIFDWGQQVIRLT